MGDSPTTDSVEHFLDARVGGGAPASPVYKPLMPRVGRLTTDADPTPDPTPTPTTEATPDPEASPDPLLTAIESIAADERATRVATSNGYGGLLIVIAILVCIMFLTAFRRDR